MVAILIAVTVVGLGVLAVVNLQRPSPLLRRAGVPYHVPQQRLAPAVPSTGVVGRGRAVGGLQVMVREEAGQVAGYEIEVEDLSLDAVLSMRTTAASMVLDQIRPDRILTGDSAFDEAVVVTCETHPSRLRALLDHTTRAMLQVEIGDGRIEVSGQRVHGHAPETTGDSRLVEQWLTRLAAVRARLCIAPAQVPERLLTIAQTDPVDAVRLACFRDLLDTYHTTPEAVSAARLAHTVPDAAIRWLAAQVLGDDGLALASSVIADRQAPKTITAAAADWLTRFDLGPLLDALGPRIVDVRAADLERLLPQPLSAGVGEALTARLADFDDAQTSVIIEAMRWSRLSITEQQLIGLLQRETPALVDFALTLLAEYGTAASANAIRRLETEAADDALTRIRERLQTGGRLALATESSGALSEAD